MFYPMPRGEINEDELFPAEFESVAPDCGPPRLFELSLNWFGLFSIDELS